jgi:hypothetical protein
MRATVAFGCLAGGDFCWNWTAGGGRAVFYATVPVERTASTLFEYPAD